MRKTVSPVLVGLVPLLLLAGCSTTPDCLEPQPYMNAQQFPPLESPPGLDVPEPDPSMAIPDVAGGPVGAYEAPADADAENTVVRCLVSPPPMPNRPA